MLDLEFMVNFIIDKRLRMDMKSIELAKKTYTFHAWKLCEDSKLAEKLIKGATVEELLDGLKNGKMLEATLDFLVGTHVLTYKNYIYKFNKKPHDLTNSEKVFLEKFYAGSIKWSELLYKHAAKTLLKAKTYKIAGFSSTETVELWDSVMNGPLYSIRKLAINKLLRVLPRGAKIADIGCGSGIAICDIIRNSKKELKISGFDYSNQMLDKSRERLNNLAEEKLTITQQKNLNNVDLVLSDITKSLKQDNFDGIFVSVVINHIEREKRILFFENIKNLMKSETKLVIFQLINQSKFERVFSDWLLYVVPSHHGFPFRDEYFNMLNKNFSRIKINLKGMIIEAKV